jgi:hypothetical protein
MAPTLRKGPNDTQVLKWGSTHVGTRTLLADLKLTVWVTKG